jgi:hypothetical protein
MAVTELAPPPVGFYAAVFFLVNLTYIFLIRELIERPADRHVPAAMRRSMLAHDAGPLRRCGRSQATIPVAY